MNRQTQAYVFGLTAVFFWSTVASAFKLSLRHLEPLQLLLYANVVSVAVMAVALQVQGKWALVRACSRRQLLRSLGLGVLNPFLYYVILFEAYARLPAQEAQTLNYSWAMTLVLLSIPLLRQKMAATDLLATVICYSGVWVIATHGRPWDWRVSDALGVGLALGSTLIWALFWIFNTKDARDSVVAMFLNFAFGLPFVAAATFLFSNLIPRHSIGLLGAAYVGVFEMGVTFVFWLTALRLSVNTARVSNLIFLSPFASLILIHFLVGEEILGSTWVGLICIMVGLGVQQWGARRAARC